MSGRNRDVIILVIIAFIVVASVISNRDDGTDELVDRSMRYTFQQIDLAEQAQ